MTELIRPSLYQSYHPIGNVTKGIIPVAGEALRMKKNPQSFNPKDLVDVVGPVCESGDFLGLKRALEADEGDLLAVFYAGAYGYSMSSNYNSRPRPAELLLDNGSATLIHPRQNINDLFQNEIY